MNKTMVITHSALSQITVAVDLPISSQFAMTRGINAATTGGGLTRPTNKAAVAAGAAIAKVAARDGGNGQGAAVAGDKSQPQCFRPVGGIESRCVKPWSGCCVRHHSLIAFLARQAASMSEA